MDIWKHGKYVDTWSIVHLLSGFLLAGAFSILEYQFSLALILSVVLLSLWEVFEWATKIIEPTINVLMDILIGVAGFLIGSYMFYILEKPFWYFYGAVVLTVLLSLWGFIDFKKRGYR